MRLRERADTPKGNGELPGLSLILFHSNDTKTMLYICLKKQNPLFSPILSARILITKASYFVL